jgi:hypothetical protein
MSAVTYGVATPFVADIATASKSKGFFTIVFEAIAASRMQQAKREIARHRHLLPPGFTLDHVNEDEPFGGW